MADHAELIQEIPALEKMMPQDRLKQARKRRTQQLKKWAQREKELVKKHKRSQHNAAAVAAAKKRKHQSTTRVNFVSNVKILEAAARGDVNEVRHVLQQGVSANLTNDDGLTALHQCCIDNNEDMMKVLMDYGADVNSKDSELWTPLHAAAACGHLNLVEYLVEQGAHLLAVNSDGNLPYDLSDNEPVLEYLESAMVSQGYADEEISQSRVALPHQMLRDLEALASQGGDLQYTDRDGATPLHIASANGYLKVVELLLSHNVQVDVRDNDGWQPIHSATCWTQPEIVKILVEHGADLEAKNYNDETPADISEDKDIQQLIAELKHEQVVKSIGQKKKAPLVRRSSSRSSKRGSSVRRTSSMEKTQLSRREAKAEAEIRQIPAPPPSQGNGVAPPGTDPPQTDLDGREAAGSEVEGQNGTGYNGLEAAEEPPDSGGDDRTRRYSGPQEGDRAHPEGVHLVANGGHDSADGKAAAATRPLPVITSIDQIEVDVPLASLSPAASDSPSNQGDPLHHQDTAPFPGDPPTGPVAAWRGATPLIQPTAAPAAPGEPLLVLASANSGAAPGHRHHKSILKTSSSSGRGEITAPEPAKANKKKGGGGGWRQKKKEAPAPPLAAPLASSPPGSSTLSASSPPGSSTLSDLKRQRLSSHQAKLDSLEPAEGGQGDPQDPRVGNGAAAHNHHQHQSATPAPTPANHGGPAAVTAPPQQQFDGERLQKFSGVTADEFGHEGEDKQACCTLL